jgi:hypothetical protein
MLTIKATVKMSLRDCRVSRSTILVRIVSVSKLEASPVNNAVSKNVEHAETFQIFAVVGSVNGSFFKSYLMRSTMNYI